MLSCHYRALVKTLCHQLSVLFCILFLSHSSCFDVLCLIKQELIKECHIPSKECKYIITGSGIKSGQQNNVSLLLCFSLLVLTY